MINIGQEKHWRERKSSRSRTEKKEVYSGPQVDNTSKNQCECRNLGAGEKLNTKGKVDN